MERDYSIRVLKRAADVLNCFNQQKPEYTLAELTNKTGLNKTTVFRILDTLEALKWVRSDPRNGTYRLGIGLFELGSRVVNGLDFYRVSYPHLEALAKATNQSAHLVIHDNGEVLYLNKLEAPGLIISQPSSIGMRQPLHCTAVGKTLMAYMPETLVENIIKEKPLEKITKNTITDKKQLLYEFEKIRKLGYAIDNEEIQVGLRCVAAPVRDSTGKVIAAISVSGLTHNMSNEYLQVAIESVISTAEAISSDLGHSRNSILAR